MRLDELVGHLPAESIARRHMSDPECDVYNVSFLTGDATREPRGDVLYFTDSELLPASVGDEKHFNCIVVDGGDAPETLVAQRNVNLVWLAPATDMFWCYNALQSVFLENQRLSGVVRRMLAAHFSNQGLQYLVEEAAEALENPIVVVDPTYHYVAYHLGELCPKDSQLAQVLAEEIANETILEEAVAYIRDSQIDSKIARSSGPYEQFNKILQCNTMTLAVMVRGVCVAHVMMMEAAHPFCDLDREAFVRLTNFVGQELQKSEVWGPTSGEMGSYFLENLLNDRTPSAAVTKRRLKSINFHPKPLLFVACLHARDEGLSQIQVEHIAAQLRPVLHHSLYTCHHRQLAILFSRDESEGLSERTERKLREVAALNGLTVGISNIFTAITESRRAYEQARAAIRYGEVSGRGLNDEGFFRYCDYAYIQALDFASRRMNLLMLCHPALRKLMEYDERHGGDLMETLFCYLQVAGSTAEAAKVLNLHKNTMLYRLGRIKEVLGMDLTSGEDLFVLQVSYRALMNLGLFSPRIAIKRS